LFRFVVLRTLGEGGEGIELLGMHRIGRKGAEAYDEWERKRQEREWQGKGPDTAAKE
jgi:hypothetical protein